MIINNSLLDIEGTLGSGEEAIRQNIEKWIKDNFNVDGLKISKNQNSDGKYEVNAADVNVINKNITSLTNELFIWSKIKKDFNCSSCHFLISLEGAPKYVAGDFGCGGCKSLKSLEGAPKYVAGYFGCYNCNSLKSLKGAPDKVGGDFSCGGCKSLKSLEGAPKEVGGDFGCYNCNSLKSLKGAPDKVGGYFNCVNCKYLKSKDLPEKTKIKGEIYK